MQKEYFVDKMSVIKEIIALVDYKTMTRFDDQLMQGQFVVTEKNVLAV